MTTGNSGVENNGASPRNRFAETGSLLGALDAMTRWRPFVLLAGTFVACMIVGGILGAVAGALMQHSTMLAGFTGLIAAIAVFIVGLIGVNAAGIMLADDVWGRPQRSISGALMASVFTSHRLVMVLLIEFLLFLVYLIALTIVLFVCKIPGVGPLLYAFVFPLAAILTGALLFAMLYVAMPLAAPAVWSGATVMQTLAMLKEVAQRKLLFVVVMMLLLGLLLFVVSGIIGGILFSGMGVTLSLSAAVIGSAMGGYGGLMDTLMGLGMGGNGSGYVWALSFGGAILFLLGATPGLLVGMKGAAIIHRTAIADLSLGEAEAQLNQRFEEVKRKAQEAKENAKAQMAAAQAAAAAHAAAAKPAESKPAEPPAPAAASVCPACSAPIAADEMFCGNCGHKLK
jgi:MFS family permease